MGQGVIFDEKLARRITDATRRVECDPYMAERPRRVHTQAGASFPWSKCSFGYSITGSNRITINGGYFCWGNRRFFATGTEFIITETTEYIQLELNWQNAISDLASAATIIQSGTNNSPDEYNFYKTLYEVPLQQPAYSVIDESNLKIRHFLDFSIPGYMSP